MNNMVIAQTATLAKALSIESNAPAELVEVLKATAFRGQVSDSQMTALLIVASQYGLNPWTKEIYAFPDKNNGIVPVVGVDGWSRIINSHAAFDGMEFIEEPEWTECIIFRKDRAHPIKVREYLAECRRANVGPWQSHPKRMLRHKAMIQCARLAFGFVGIYEPDEADRIIEGEAVEVRRPSKYAALPVLDGPERDEALAEAEAAAKQGTQAYAAFWSGWTKEKRKLVADKHDEFKNIAALIDAERRELESAEDGEAVRDAA